MVARLPVLALLIGWLGLGMLLPSLKAALEYDWLAARGFLSSGVVCLFAAAALAILFRPHGRHEQSRRELTTLLIAWAVLPCFAALPLVLVTPWIGTLGAWFEMVAAFTTTGGSVYRDALLVPESVHLWRGLVGWSGGLLTLVSAYAVLAPRRLGGFEVMSASELAAEGRAVDLRLPGAPFGNRLSRALRTILPVYAAMTAALALLFNALAEPGLVASVHAMSIVSTSGITPLPDGLATARSLPVELIAAVFLIAAASRFFYAGASQIGRRVDWRTDPELRLMGVLVGLATVALFLRHWVAAIESPALGGVHAGLVALWGAAFTSLSFLTTTGFESAAWHATQDWSGHANPAMILLALCAIGGGAATTAGGIKLIRAYAMLCHAGRELTRIVAPHSVAGTGLGSRGLRREGAMIAWTFVMLFSLGFVAVLMLLTVTGMEFADALIAATAALSNTGPLFAQAAELPGGFARLDGAQRIILAAAMLLGRIETLAAIVLLHPESWARRLRGPERAGAKRTGKDGAESPLSRW
ncbi:MAG TPA: potassium transporter TrkG [Paracoccaceae bacterium]|nr:potassium transporter TrkG [Paracoccaceae bacterium]